MSITAITISKDSESFAVPLAAASSVTTQCDLVKTWACGSFTLTSSHAAHQSPKRFQRTRLSHLDGRPRHLTTETSYEQEIVDVARRLTEYDEAFLECRTIGHAWMVSYVGPVAKADTDLRARARRHPWNPDAARVLTCQRCKTQRIDLCVVGYGRNEYSYRMVSRQYRYDGNYKVEGANDHRGLLHEELFRRNQ